jgi:DNA-3-methyladenine glycosylase
LNALHRSFYLQPTLTVARNLLGKNIVRYFNDKFLIGKIVEVEAYLHNDPASHSFRRKTRRNEVMFYEGGHLYVYFTYGMHFCANVVTGKEGIGEAVLIRAVEPLAGIEVMIKNRHSSDKSIDLRSLNHKILIDLTNGPAKFCKAFGIARKENGTDLTSGGIIITDGLKILSKSIGRSSRIGIRSGLEKKWRFFINGNEWVSRE